jgi:hypothetical protein
MALNNQLNFYSSTVKEPYFSPLIYNTSPGFWTMVMGANNGALGEYLGCIFFGASWAVTKRKHFLFKGIFCCKFLILKNNLSINAINWLFEETVATLTHNNY